MKKLIMFIFYTYFVYATNPHVPYYSTWATVWPLDDFQKNVDECFDTQKGESNPQIFNYLEVPSKPDTQYILPVESKNFYCLDKPNCRMRNGLQFFLFTPENYNLESGYQNRYCPGDDAFFYPMHEPFDIFGWNNQHCENPYTYIYYVVKTELLYSTDMKNWKVILKASSNTINKDISTNFANTKGYLRLDYYNNDRLITPKQYNEGDINWILNPFISQNFASWLNITYHKNGCTVKP